MEFLQLKYFQTVARLEHISNAAKELNITQPSLSIMISRLESEMGTPLFVRKGRNIKLNEMGVVLLKHVNTIFSELEDAKVEIQDVMGSSIKNISLATTSTRLLSGILKDFLEAYPETTIHQYLNSRSVIESNMIKGETDFCISIPAIENDEIDFTVLREDEIVLVVPLNHRLANKESIVLSEVSDEFFISLATSYSYRKITDDLCQAAGFIPKVIFEVDDALMYEMLQLGRGVTLVPLSTCNTYSNEPYKILKITEPDTSIMVALCWKKNKYISHAAEDFKKFVIEHYR